MLEAWFKERVKDTETDKNFWKRNKIGKLLKTNLKQLKHWKNKSGGGKIDLAQLEKARAIRAENIEKTKELPVKPVELKAKSNIDF